MHDEVLRLRAELAAANVPTFQAASLRVHDDVGKGGQASMRPVELSGGSQAVLKQPHSSASCSLVHALSKDLVALNEAAVAVRQSAARNFPLLGLVNEGGTFCGYLLRHMLGSISGYFVEPISLSGRLK